MAEDFAQTYGQTYIEQETFPVLTDILRRIQDRNGDLSAQKQWFDEICPAEPVIFEYETKATQAVGDVIRATVARDALKMASRALVQLLECISFQATSAEKYVTTTQRRRRFSSLPDEILAVVLENATYDRASADSTVKAATTLSHTCRRFRRIMIHIPMLWNRINHYFTPSMISTCCDRLPNTYVEVELKVESRSQPHLVAEFVNAAKQYSIQWRTFEYCSLSQYSSVSVEVARGCVEELARETYTLDASSLTSLSIAYHGNPPRLVNGNRFRDAVHFYSTWSIPRLSWMNARGIIPIPFSGSTSLKTLYLDLSFSNEEPFDLKALVTFLASCVTLEEFSMTFSGLEIDETTLEVEPVNMGCVRKASFEFEYCPRKVVTFVTGAFRLPKASFMRLDVGTFCLYDVTESPEFDGDLKVFLPSIFSDASHYPDLVELFLKIGSSSASYTAFSSREGREEPRIPLPFNKLPKVEYLYLNMGTSIPSAIPIGECLPSLRVLHLENCLYLDAGWLPSFLGRLEAQGTLRGLTVSNCSYVAPPMTSTLDPGQSDATGEGGVEKPRFVKYTLDDLHQLTKIR